MGWKLRAGGNGRGVIVRHEVEADIHAPSMAIAQLYTFLQQTKEHKSNSRSGRKTCGSCSGRGAMSFRRRARSRAAKSERTASSSPAMLAFLSLSTHQRELSAPGTPCLSKDSGGRSQRKAYVCRGSSLNGFVELTGVHMKSSLSTGPFFRLLASFCFRDSS